MYDVQESAARPGCYLANSVPRAPNRSLTANVHTVAQTRAEVL
jgi:hypothetical protein